MKIFCHLFLALFHSLAESKKMTVLGPSDGADLSPDFEYPITEARSSSETSCSLSQKEIMATVHWL
jgi:hypothetical protein